MLALYASTVFLSAFLLFQIQPVIAKPILPWFGGSSAVWSVCMLFFQAGLLGGYAYAHWSGTRMAPRRQALLHSLLLFVSLAALPVAASAAWKPTGAENPALRILGLLAATVGLPYFLLAATSPLLQSWYARTHKGAVPYRLFALSNAASLGALLSYPFLIEPHMAVRAQETAWSAGYAVFAVLCAATAWASAIRAPHALEPEGAAASAGPAAPAKWLWIGLAACPSVLLLATTTYLTQDVAAIPFLWILPLAVYLLTFILCFESGRFYRRAVFLPALAVAVLLLGLLFRYNEWKPLVPANVAVTSLCLFVICMACHGELARLKPHPRHLTAYYLMISVGGALGGLFVGLFAPYAFNGYYEFPLGLAGAAALVAVAVLRGTARRRWVECAVAAALLAYSASLAWTVRWSSAGCRVVARNFYGQLRVKDYGDAWEEDASRALLHGVINHGQQMRSEMYRLEPVSYFCPDTGIGRILRASQGRPRRIGILGLGCGTLAAYGQARDALRIYEINPLVVELARKQFTYLKDTKASTELAMGDGRLSLEREPAQQFDVLVMDAFSGDSVPVHLITREAFALYFRHLKADGVLAVNVSNRYLDLTPVIASAAEQFGKTALVFHYDPDGDDALCFSCSWALVMSEDTRRAYAPAMAAGSVLRPRPSFRVWTDDYSSMYGILK